MCPSELLAFDSRVGEFAKRGVEVIGVSIDSHFTHNAWRNTLLTKAVLAQLSTHWWPTLTTLFVKPMTLSQRAA